MNANPQRLDLSAPMVRAAIEVGVRIVIGTDAHALDHLDFLELGVVTCRRGWAEKKHVLNCLPWEELLAMRKRGK